MSQHGKYRLNVRFLGRLLLLIVVLGTGAFFLHRYQERRLTSRYLTQADQARADALPLKEIDYLRQYISLNPDDNAARVRYGMVLAKTSKNRILVESAYFTLQTALRNDPTLPVEVRLQCAKLALRPDINKPNEAKSVLETLLTGDPENADYQERYAEALIRSGLFSEAENYLTRITSRDKTRIDATALLAWLKWDRNRNSPEAASLIWRQMLQHPVNEINPRAWLLAADYYRTLKQTREYTEALAQARLLAPNDPEVLLATADQILNAWRATAPVGVQPTPTPQFEEAVAMLDRALKVLGPLPSLDPMPEAGSPELRKLDLAMRLYNRIAYSYLLADRYDDAERYARELVKKFPDFPQQQVVLLDVLVHKQQYPEAEALCAKLSLAGVAPALVELQRGFMAAQQKKWVDASRYLERTVIEVANYPDLGRRAQHMLAMCYEHTGELDRRLEAIVLSVPANHLDPTWVPTMLSAADASAQSGKTQDAIQKYRDILDKEPKALVPLVRLLIGERARQLGETAGDRDAEIELLLNKVPAGPLADILRSQYLLAKKQTAAARDLLASSLAKQPTVHELWLALYELEVQSKQPAAAKSVVDRAAAQLGDCYDVRQLKISLLVDQSGGDSKHGPALEALAAGLEKFQPGERQQLLKMLSNAARFINRRDLASQWLERLIAERGDQDMELQYLRFDVALLDGDEAKIDKVLADIEALAGDRNAPPCKLSRAFSLIFKADRLKDQSSDQMHLLEQATELLNGLETKRKEWGRLYLAQAKVADMMGRRDVAIEKYNEAIEHGERGAEIFGRLADLYFLEKKTDQVKNLMAKYPEAATLLTGQNDRFLAMLIEAHDYARAKEAARRAVPENCTDPEKLYWLFRILNTCEDPLAAEAPLRKAQKLAPQNGEYWLSLVHILVKNGKKGEAKQFVEGTKESLKGDDAPIYTAQAYTFLDETARSREIFDQLLRSRPNDLVVVRAAGKFYFWIGDYVQAGPLMEKLLRDPGRTPVDEDDAKRCLARCAAVSRDHNSGIRALSIIGYASPDAATSFSGNETLEDLRCRFEIISVIKGRAARLATLALLREIERKAKGLTNVEQIAYGQIQYSLGDWGDSQRRLMQAANAREGGANAIVIYATALLRKGELELAQQQIARMFSLEPDSQRTAELIARLAVLTGRKKDAVDTLKRFAAGAKGRTVIAAALLEQLGLADDAGALYRRAVEEDASNPEMRLFYAGYLARNGRPAESLDEFEKVWDRVPPEKTVPLLCDAMMNASQTMLPSTAAKAGERIAAEAQKNPALLPYLAAFKSFTNQIPEAISLSEQILAKDPNHVFTLNNLAFMRSLGEGKHNDAIAMIRHAIAIVGPLPTLMDTEATILIAAGKPNEAIERLNEVIVDDPAATAYMHLAQAYLAANRRTEAIIAIREAKKNNLRMDDFHPLERNNLRAVLAQLGG